MATRRVLVEYILRRLPQEGLEGEPVDRIREAYDNKYTGAYKHDFCGDRKCEVAYKSFIICTVEYDTHKSCRQNFHRVYLALHSIHHSGDKTPFRYTAFITWVMNPLHSVTLLSSQGVMKPIHSVTLHSSQG